MPKKNIYIKSDLVLNPKCKLYFNLSKPQVQKSFLETPTIFLELEVKLGKIKLKNGNCQYENGPSASLLYTFGTVYHPVKRYTHNVSSLNLLWYKWDPHSFL